MENLSWQPTAPNMINLTTNNDGLKNGNFFKLWLILGMYISYINFYDSTSLLDECVVQVGKESDVHFAQVGLDLET